MRANSDIGLIVPDVHLFHDRDRCKRFLEGKMHVKADFLDADGQMFYYSGTAVIMMEHKGKPETELSLLVHEAYHAAIAHMGWLGEDEAGEETMAYLMQTITNGLFKAHRKWKKRKGLVE